MDLKKLDKHFGSGGRCFPLPPLPVFIKPFLKIYKYISNELQACFVLNTFHSLGIFNLHATRHAALT